MNKKQLIVMWVGIVVFVYLGLTTPTSHFGGIGSPRTIDYGPLIVRLSSTVILTAGLIYTLKDKKKKDD